MEKRAQKFRSFAGAEKTDRALELHEGRNSYF